MIAVFVAGNPAPQGSVKFVGRAKNGRGILTSDCKRTKPWRTNVRSALLDEDGHPKATFAGGVHLEVEFVMQRPKDCPKKSTPPAMKKPDLDKLQRAVFDAIGSAGVWRDDAQVVSVFATKRLAKIGETPGCHLDIMDAIEREKAAL